MFLILTWIAIAPDSEVVIAPDSGLVVKTDVAVKPDSGKNTDNRSVDERNAIFLQKLFKFTRIDGSKVFIKGGDLREPTNQYAFLILHFQLNDDYKEVFIDSASKDAQVIIRFFSDCTRLSKGDKMLLPGNLIRWTFRKALAELTGTTSRNVAEVLTVLLSAANQNTGANVIMNEMNRVLYQDLYTFGPESKDTMATTNRESTSLGPSGSYNSPTFLNSGSNNDTHGEPDWVIVSNQVLDSVVPNQVLDSVVPNQVLDSVVPNQVLDSVVSNRESLSGYIIID